MADRRSLPARLRFSVLERDRFTCRYCGAQAPEVRLEVDHVYPAAKGGGDVMSNLVTSCETCNAGKADRVLTDAAFEAIALESKSLVAMVLRHAWRDPNCVRQLYDLALSSHSARNWNDEMWGLLGHLDSAWDMELARREKGQVC
jgi:hypothetical protein